MHAYIGADAGERVLAGQLWSITGDRSGRAGPRFLSDGEQGWIVVDGVKVWTHALDNCVVQVQSNYCGAGGPPCFGDVDYKAAATVNHNAANVTFGGGSSLDQGPSDESFGIDNVVVWIK